MPNLQLNPRARAIRFSGAAMDERPAQEKVLAAGSRNNPGVGLTATATDTSQLVQRYAAIPGELKGRQQWIGWLNIRGEGRPAKLPNGAWTSVLKPAPKPHKLPINPRTGGLASTTRPSTWASFLEALAAATKWPLAGVGYVFSKSDAYSGVDIDNCRDPLTGELAVWASPIILSLNSYTEVSPSGTGVHTIVRAELPVGEGNQVVYQQGKVEMFSHARYFTFSGVHITGTSAQIFDRQSELLALHSELFAGRNVRTINPDSVLCPHTSLDDDELIARASQARNGSKFGRLWNGHWRDDYASQSEADLALCSALAFWTGKDPTRIDTLFRRSGLMRKKWLRDRYRLATISKAL